MTEQNDNTVTSTQLTDMDSTIIKDAISDLNNICERDRVKPGIQSILKDITDNLASILPVKTMAQTPWNDKEHTLRQATYTNPHSGESEDVIMLFESEEDHKHITILDLNTKTVCWCKRDELIPQDTQYTI